MRRLLALSLPVVLCACAGLLGYGDAAELGPSVDGGGGDAHRREPGDGEPPITARDPTTPFCQSAPAGAFCTSFDEATSLEQWTLPESPGGFIGADTANHRSPPASLLVDSSPDSYSP